MMVDQSYRNQTYSHKKEFCCVSILNSYFCKENMPVIAYREDGGKYSSYDIDVFLFDFINMESKGKLYSIDVESKPENAFIDWPNSYNQPNLSFLYRKVNKINSDYNLYVLYNKKDINQIVWQSYAFIRNHFDVVVGEPKCERNVFYRLPSHRIEMVNWNWDGIVEYTKSLIPYEQT